MSDRRVLTWYESQKDAGDIAKSGWNFQLVKEVASDRDSPRGNVVWQSKRLAPRVRIGWKEEYALNWTADLGSPGVQVMVGGVWQPCNKGESYDINDDGFWQRSNKPGKDGWLNVGNVAYRYPETDGIHIIVGIKNEANGEFEPIYVDEARKPVGSSGSYQPKGSLTWWLEGGDRTSQICEGPGPGAMTQDFSKPSPGTGSYEWWTTFSGDSQSWTFQDSRPSN